MGSTWGQSTGWKRLCLHRRTAGLPAWSQAGVLPAIGLLGEMAPCTSMRRNRVETVSKPVPAHAPQTHEDGLWRTHGLCTTKMIVQRMGRAWGRRWEGLGGTVVRGAGNCQVTGKIPSREGLLSVQGVNDRPTIGLPRGCAGVGAA